MKKSFRILASFLAAFCIVLAGTGLASAKAATMPSSIAAPESVTVDYGYDCWDGRPSGLCVTYSNNPQIQKLADEDGISVSAQIDWRFSDGGEWSYCTEWDEGKYSDMDNYPFWELIGCPVSSYEDNCTAILFDYYDTDDYNWKEEGCGFSCVVPKTYLTKLTIADKEITSIDWNKYSVDVRVRYFADQELEYDDELGEYPHKYQVSDWSDIVTYGNYSADYADIDNLLVNPDFEEGLKGWKNPDKCWQAVIASDVGNARHGRVLTWPVTGASAVDGDGSGEKTRIYQDVDISGFKADETMIFKTLICNYDQAPHDMGKVSLAFLDSDGKSVKDKDGKNVVYSQAQRNPNWNAQTIICSIPEGAATVRVSLYACRYVGWDIDAYYDYCSLVVKPEKIYPVVVTEKNNKSKVKAGDKIQLTADNSKSKKASDYVWSSSYNTGATVDENGLVTFHTDAEDGLAIYATDRESGVTGVYWFNCTDETNASSVLDVSVAKPTSAPAKISRLTAGSKAITVSWKKVKGVKGYEIRYALKKNMKSARTVAVKKASTVKKKLTKLKGATRYYVQIRTYTVVNGKKVYSAWSTAKSLKTGK